MPIHSLPAALLGSAAALVAPAQSPVHRFHADHVLGTSLDVAIVSAGAPMAALALEAIRAEIARLDMILSGWREDSELAALNRTARHSASPDLFAVLAAGEAWRSQSGGAFRLAAEPLMLDAAARTVARPAGLRLEIDAIAKGYVIDRALDAAFALPGIAGAMVDIGGDLCCRGLSPDGKAWRIGVADAFTSADNAPPAALLALGHGAVASSGSFARGHRILRPDGSVSDTRMATAVAPTAADADALATIFHVLPAARAIALADSLPGVAAHIVGCDGRVALSKGWTQLAQNIPPKAPANTAWPAGFSVKIDYEIPRFTSSLRLYPPYVTIWITNAAGEEVRTLVFHAARQRYMRENYVFWDKIGRNNQALVDAVTRPTRGPGAYTILWEGRDDARQPLPQGRYTINIETAREHGGHSLQRIPIELGAAPATASAAAEEEMGPVTVTYGRQ